MASSPLARASPRWSSPSRDTSSFSSRASSGSATAAASRLRASHLACRAKRGGASTSNSSGFGFPPAAPPNFLGELERLRGAGVDVHDFGVEYMCEGETSERVAELQRYLAGEGHYKYRDGATGYFGPITVNAVKNWQRFYGVKPSGGWGVESREAYLRERRILELGAREGKAARGRVGGPGGREDVIAEPDFGFAPGTTGLLPPTPRSAKPPTVTREHRVAHPPSLPQVVPHVDLGGVTTIGGVTASTALWVGGGAVAAGASAWVVAVVAANRLKKYKARIAAAEGDDDDDEAVAREKLRERIGEKWDANEVKARLRAAAAGGGGGGVKDGLFLDVTGTVIEKRPTRDGPPSIEPVIDVKSDPYPGEDK